MLTVRGVHMRVLVTGGVGRLGVDTSRALQKAGYQVRVFDLPTPRNRKSAGEIGRGAEVFWGDITDGAAVGKALDGVDAIVHMAGILPPVSESHPELAARVNVGGTVTLVNAIVASGRRIPLVFTSSVAVFGPTPLATKPVSVDRNAPNPKDVYGQTKQRAEELIRQSGIDCVILRLSASVYTSFEMNDIPRLYGIPLETRMEFCHPEEACRALVNAVVNFEGAKGETLIISGGPKGRMLYRDMVRGILGIMRLPVPPDRKFTRQPYYLDFYDTSKSQQLLRYQHKTFSDYLGDCRGTLARRFTPAFVPFMCHFVGPLFGRIIARIM